MFPCWANNELQALPRQSMSLLSATATVMLLFLGSPAWLGGIAEAADDEQEHDSHVTGSGTVRSGRSGSLDLGLRYADPHAAARLHKRTNDLLTLASCLDDFDCRMSSQILTCGRSSRLSAEGPFRDVLLNVPVRGTAHVDGHMRIVPTASADNAVLEMHIEGTARMIGAGTTHGVRLDSDATTRFHVTKKLLLDHTGMTSERAACQATTALVSKGVSAQQPRLIGRLTERIARRRVQESQREAEAECSAHVADALRAAVDREVDTLAQAMNAALAEHLAAATEAERVRWQNVRFHTEANCLCVSRGTGSLENFAEYQVATVKPPPALVLRLPRARLDMNRLLAGMHLLRPADAGSLATAPMKGENQMALQPSLSWQDKTVTVSLHYGPTARLAQEPSVGLSQ